MKLLEEIRSLSTEYLNTLHKSCTTEKVRKIISQRVLSYEDFLCLLSPAAAEILPEMAARARDITIQRFGRIIQFYAPVYLSNVCSNHCVYCGFNHTTPIKRTTLGPAEIEQEFSLLKESGMDSVLLLTGEAPAVVGLDYLEEAVRLAAAEFTFTGLEIYPLEEKGYARLAAAGADGLTVYQETYNEKIYARMHPAGRKKDYIWRLTTPARALSGGMRKVGLGFLLGLANWKQEAARLALHTRQLQKEFWKGELTLSFPRIQPFNNSFQPPQPVSDREFIQLICALRLYFPDISFLLSTRETPQLRDRLVELCVTQLSAGSRTNPGGYSRDDTEEQFAVADERSLEDMMTLVSSRGYEPVLKDWDRVF